MTVVDQFSREWPLLEADFSLSGKKVAACLKRAGTGVGLAESDHGGQWPNPRGHIRLFSGSLLRKYYPNAGVALALTYLRAGLRMAANEEPS